MEQARCWMWTKRKEPSGINIQAPIKPSYDDSWEEQAFAKDTCGDLGGCVWPPRSYSCTFCRREFRSAQALGGHMNVHRRDRARLKEYPNHSHGEILQQEHQNNYTHLQNTYTSLGFQCPLVCNSPNPSSDLGSIVSPSSPSRISTTPTQENPTKNVSLFTPFYSSTTKEEQNKSSSPRFSKPLWPNAERCYLGSSNSRSNDGEKISPSRSIDQLGYWDKVDHLKTGLSVSLNLVVRQTCPITILDDDEEEEEEKEKEVNNRSKRRRIDSSPFFLKSNDSDDCHSPCFIEELDLELRLGGRPKVQ